MLLNSSKNKCILNVLKILNNNSASYSDLFRKTKVSHITLQTVLKELLEKELIMKEENDGCKKEYWITDKGKLVLKKIKSLSLI